MLRPGRWTCCTYERRSQGQRRLEHRQHSIAGLCTAVQGGRKQEPGDERHRCRCCPRREQRRQWRGREWWWWRTAFWLGWLVCEEDGFAKRVTGCWASEWVSGLENEWVSWRSRPGFIGMEVEDEGRGKMLWERERPLFISLGGISRTRSSRLYFLKSARVALRVVGDSTLAQRAVATHFSPCIKRAAPTPSRPILQLMNGSGLPASLHPTDRWMNYWMSFEPLAPCVAQKDKKEIGWNG